MLVDDTIRAADKARWAGVDVGLRIWPDLPHVFQAVRWLPETAQALADVGAFVARHVAAVAPGPGHAPEPTHHVQTTARKEPAS